MRFVGLKNEAHLRAEYGPIADGLIESATSYPMRVCSLGKQCVGSIDGKTFLYADGSKDNGRTINCYEANWGGTLFKWSGN